MKYTPLKFLRIQINQQGVMDDEDDYTGISTKIKMPMCILNDETGTVTNLT